MKISTNSVNVQNVRCSRRRLGFYKLFKQEELSSIKLFQGFIYTFFFFLISTWISEVKESYLDFTHNFENSWTFPFKIHLSCSLLAELGGVYVWLFIVHVKLSCFYSAYKMCHNSRFPPSSCKLLLQVIFIHCDVIRWEQLWRRCRLRQLFASFL